MEKKKNILESWIILQILSFFMKSCRDFGQVSQVLGRQALDFKSFCRSLIIYRDVTAGATGATAVTPKFSDALTLFQPGGGRFCPTIAEVAP